MSIWCSWPTIGRDEWDPDALGGQVLTYAAGFSNHYPRPADGYELPASVHLAHVAPWCVPGHDQVAHGSAYRCSGCGEAHDIDAGDWIRLGIHAADATETRGGGQVTRTGPVAAMVVLDIEAATLLRNQLDHLLQVATVRAAPEDALGGLSAPSSPSVARNYIGVISGPQNGADGFDQASERRAP